MSGIGKAGGPQVIGALSSVSFAGENFSPIDIPDLSMWLDATDPNNDGIQPPNGTSISVWRDKSSNANDVFQAVGANQFIYGTNVINGKSAMASDNIKSMATAGNPINWPTGSSTPRTMFVVVQLNIVASFQLLTREDDLGNGTAFSFDYDGSSFILDSGGTGGYVILDQPPFVITGVPFSMSFLGNNTPFTSASFQVNATDVTITPASYNPVGTVNPTPFLLSFPGSGVSLDGFYCEVIVYKRLLTTQQRNQVNNYLISKWGII